MVVWLVVEGVSDSVQSGKSPTHTFCTDLAHKNVYTQHNMNHFLYSHSLVGMEGPQGDASRH